MPKRRRGQDTADPQAYLAENVPDAHRSLLEHVLAGGAELSKVKIAQLPHGTGIVASERIRANEDITFIPTSLLLNVHDTPIPNSSPLDHPTRVHSSLAAHLASTKHDGGDAFTLIMPSESSFKTSMPVFWPNQVLEQCSPWVRSFALKQKDKLSADYEHAVRIHQAPAGGMRFSREEFDWGWAVVNTRTIHYRPKKWAKVPAEDCMTMCPFIDYYNHDWRSDKTCVVSFSTDGLRVTTRKSYAPGEEIFVTYGDYNNDNLLVEYGFMLPQNGSDGINIDFWVLAKLSRAKQDILKDATFHGDYTLDSTSGVCYRTTTALRLAVIDEKYLPRGTGTGGEQYRDFVKLVWGDVEEDEYISRYSDDEKKAAALLEDTVEDVIKYAQGSVGKLQEMEMEGASAAVERWGQVLEMLERYKGRDQPMEGQ